MNNLLRETAGEIAARATVGHATQEMTEHHSHVTADEKAAAQQSALGSLASPPETPVEMGGPHGGAGLQWGGRRNLVNAVATKKPLFPGA